MPDLAIDRALAAVRSAIVVTGPDLVRAVRVGCYAVFGRCQYPKCNAIPGCAEYEVALCAALAEVLAEHDRRVTELLAANTAEVERRRAAEALAGRMWPYVEAAAKVGAICGNPDEVSGYGDVQMIAVFTVAQCRAAAALVREREGKDG